MSSLLRITLVILVCVLILTSNCNAKRKKGKKTASMTQAKQATDTVEGKQSELRETNPPNFVRLVVMRLIYGIATQMGLEERISGVLNGAFAPPNADYDDFGLDDLDGAGDLFDV